MQLLNIVCKAAAQAVTSSVTNLAPKIVTFNFLVEVVFYSLKYEANFIIFTVVIRNDLCINIMKHFSSHLKCVVCCHLPC